MTARGLKDATPHMDRHRQQMRDEMFKPYVWVVLTGANTVRMERRKSVIRLSDPPLPLLAPSELPAAINPCSKPRLPGPQADTDGEYRITIPA